MSKNIYDLPQPDLEQFFSIPFVQGGRSFEGADCWGLVYLYYQVMDIEIPAYDYYAVGINTLETLRKIKAEKAAHWDQVENPAHPDVVFMRHGELQSHVGIYLGAGDFLHIETGRDVAVHNVKDFEWKHKVLGYFRPKCLASQHPKTPLASA